MNDDAKEVGGEMFTRKFAIEKDKVGKDPGSGCFFFSLKQRR
jgi:hypothetical protein